MFHRLVYTYRQLKEHGIEVDELMTLRKSVGLTASVGFQVGVRRNLSELKVQANRTCRCNKSK
ncbi:hypothetical protein [Paenibacillus sp. PvR148]